MAKPESILLTGGLGFQGRHLALAWLLQGRRVTILNTPSERARHVASRLVPKLPKGCRIVYGSVNDPEIVEKIIPGHDAIVHLAAWSSVDSSLDRPKPSLMINANGTQTLLDGIRAYAPANVRILLASSCEVYGPAHVRPDCYTAAHPYPEGEGKFVLPQGEESAMLPRSPYAASKLAADRLAYAYAIAYSMNLSILRPSNIFGPGQRPGAWGAVIPTLTRQALTGEPMTIMGGGEQFREFLHVDDLVSAYTILLDRVAGEAGEVFNIGSGEIRTIKEIATALGNLSSTTGARLLMVPARVADVSGFLLDSSKAHVQLSWKPTVRFDDGLERYFNWAKAMGTEAWK